MTDQPRRITPADFAALLDRLNPVPPDAQPAERLAYLELKAAMLSRLAAELDSAEGYQLSAAAWEQARDLLCDNSQWEVAS